MDWTLVIRCVLLIVIKGIYRSVFKGFYSFVRSPTYTNIHTHANTRTPIGFERISENHFFFNPSTVG